MEPMSLKALCARHICFEHNYTDLSSLLPPSLRNQVNLLFYSISQTKELYDAFRYADEKNFIINSLAFEVDRVLSVLSMERLLTKPQYFTLCAIHALDEETARVYASMTNDEKKEIDDENAVVNVRIGELSRIPPIPFYYETAAYIAARNGWLESFHKYLMKVEQDDAERVTARCVLKAIVHKNYHIANATPVKSFGDEFYSEFPDGKISPKFFSTLLVPGLLRPELGRKLAEELISWLPVLDLDMLRHRLDGENLAPELFLECANMLDEKRLRNVNLQDMQMV